MAYYFGDALKELKKVKGMDDGHLDLMTLPEFAQSQEVRGEQEVVVGRDLGAMVSMLTVAVQQLAARLDKLEQK